MLRTLLKENLGFEADACGPVSTRWNLMSRGVDCRSRAACWASRQVSKVFFRRGAAFKLDWNDSCLQFFNGLKVLLKRPKAGIVIAPQAPQGQRKGLRHHSSTESESASKRGPCIQNLLFHSTWETRPQKYSESTFGYGPCHSSRYLHFLLGHPTPLVAPVEAPPRGFIRGVIRGH
jgi:hypothetical protein